MKWPFVSRKTHLSALHRATRAEDNCSWWINEADRQIVRLQREIDVLDRLLTHYRSKAIRLEKAANLKRDKQGRFVEKEKREPVVSEF